MRVGTGSRGRTEPRVPRFSRNSASRPNRSSPNLRSQILPIAGVWCWNRVQYRGPSRSSRIPSAPGNPRGTTHEDRGGEGMHWIVTVIVGAVVGWLASMLMKTNAQMGAIANIVVGIVGSSLGFWLAGVLGLSTGGPIVGWVVAVLGAALLIFILKAVGIFT